MSDNQLRDHSTPAHSSVCLARAVIAGCAGRPRKAWFGAAVLLLLMLSGAGCAGPKLMPTPNVYRGRAEDPFASVPAVFQTNVVDLLYVTDRRLERGLDARPAYTHGRSPQLVYGTGQVRFGGEVTWERLVAESRSASRTTRLPVRVVWVQELGQFPPLPPAPEPTPLGLRPTPGSVERSQRAVSGFQREVERRLALTPRKEAFVYVHGFNNDFEWALGVAAQLWHFLPRAGVPIVYSWPAGHGGIRGYTYDRESSEFTVYHLKQMLRALAACPNLERVHLIAHSRGTDVASSAVRELLIEARGSGVGLTRVAKLENLVLIAPDLDLEVAAQRIAAEGVPLAVGRLTVYVREKDRAIGLANWLFEGIRRLGQVRVQDFTEAQRYYMRRARSVQFVDARVKADFLGHGYFHSNPAVSSDLLQLLRENCDAGSDCRPLVRAEDLLWKIKDDYLAPLPR